MELLHIFPHELNVRVFFCFCFFVFVFLFFFVYLQLFVGGLMSYLRYLCLFAHSGVQRILCCVFALYFFILSILCWLWIVHFLLPFLYCLTFINVCSFLIFRDLIWAFWSWELLYPLLPYIYHFWLYRNLDIASFMVLYYQFLFLV